MVPHHAWLRIALILLFAAIASRPALTGGMDLNDDDAAADNGPAYFGFVREVGGAGIGGANVSAALKSGNSVVTSTDIMGVYKLPGLGKDVNPDEVTISCAKQGYKQADVQRRPRADADAKDPIEVECYLQKQ